MHPNDRLGQRIDDDDDDDDDDDVIFLYKIWQD